VAPRPSRWRTIEQIAVELPSRVAVLAEDLEEDHLSGRFPYRPDTPSRVASLGLDPEAEYVVVLAVEVDTRAPSDPSVRERVRDALERHSRRHAASFLVVVRDTDVIAIRSPPTSARTIAEAAVGQLGSDSAPGLAVGISERCPRLGDAARRHVEALRAATVVRHTGGVAAISEIGLFDYLAAHADTTARRLLPGSAHKLATAKSGGEPLARTLEAYLDSDLSVPLTAARLSVHPKTVRYRLEKIEALTGLDTRRFWDLAELAAGQRILVRDTSRSRTTG
jgi:sugar diacid utilization regulator